MLGGAGNMVDIPDTFERNPQPGPPGNRKRRRGMSPVSKVQRPRVSVEEGIRALDMLSPAQQEMVEGEAARGIVGDRVIHR